MCSSSGRKAEWDDLGMAAHSGVGSDSVVPLVSSRAVVVFFYNPKGIETEGRLGHTAFSYV